MFKIFNLNRPMVRLRYCHGHWVVKLNRTAKELFS